tara:strand:- start:2512 stop:2805 length:294 start_codon:yes stop_codon:yes gene_type:complete
MVSITIAMVPSMKDVYVKMVRRELVVPTLENVKQAPNSASEDNGSNVLGRSKRSPKLATSLTMTVTARQTKEMSAQPAKIHASPIRTVVAVVTNSLA